MSRKMPLFVIGLLTSTSASAQSYTQVGSYRMSDAPDWRTQPTSYNCVQACALTFGGDESEYRCSTVAGTRNNQAWVDGYAMGCSASSDTLYTPGNYTSSGNRSAYVNDNCASKVNYCWHAPPATTADAGGPYNAVEGIAVTLSGVAVNATSQAWDCEDNGSTESTVATVSCTYPDQGNFTARFTATGTSAVSDTATITVSNADPIITAFNVPTDGSPNSAIAMSVNATDVDTLTYAWDFGDGTTGTGASPNHTWLAQGEYTVSVVVSDGDGGSATDSAVLDLCTDIDGDGICDDIDPCTLGEPYDWDGGGFDDGCRGDNNTIDPTVLVPAGTKTGDDVTIGAHAVIGTGNVFHNGVWVATRSQVGDNNVLGEGVIVSRRAELGDDNAVESDTLIGREAQIGSGVQLGSWSVVGYAATVGDNVSVPGRLTLGSLARLGGAGASPGAVVCPGPLVIARSSQVAADTPWTFQCTGQVTVGPDSVIGSGADFGSTIRLRKSTTLGDRVFFGDSVRIGRGATLQSDVSVLDSVRISPGVQLCDTDTPFEQDLSRTYDDPTCP